MSNRLDVLRAVFGVIGGLGAGYAIASLCLLTPKDFAAGLILAAGASLGIGLIRALQTDRSNKRRYRSQVWARRDREAHR